MTETPARTGAEILEQIQPRLRVGTAHICLRPDLLDAWQTAQDELVEAKAEDAKKERLGSGGTSAKTRKAAEKVRDLEEQIAASDVAFRFRGMSKARHQAICEQHPPREKNMLDFTVGYNREAVDNATVLECLVEPVFEQCTRKGCAHADCGTWDQMLGVLNPSEWQELVRVTQEVNGVTTEAPKSLLASRILDKPARGSRPRATGV